MEIKVLSEEKDFIELEIKDETHTFCNVLRDELTRHDEVSFSAYKIEHPLVSQPVLIVKTKEGKPRKALEKAVSSLKAEIKSIRNATKKL